MPASPDSTGYLKIPAAQYSTLQTLISANGYSGQIPTQQQDTNGDWWIFVGNALGMNEEDLQNYFTLISMSAMPFVGQDSAPTWAT